MIEEAALLEIKENPGSLVLHCMVCKEPLSPARAKDSKRATCSPECYKALKYYRKEMTRQRRCPSCLHPATLAEREDFKRWRTERGQRKGNRGDGRPPKKRQEALEGVLVEILSSLQGSEGSEDKQNSGEYSQQEEAGQKTKLEQAISQATKLLDQKTIG